MPCHYWRYGFFAIIIISLPVSRHYAAVITSASYAAVILATSATASAAAHYASRHAGVISLRHCRRGDAFHGTRPRWFLHGTKYEWVVISSRKAAIDVTFTFIHIRRHLRRSVCRATLPIRRGHCSLEAVHFHFISSLFSRWMPYAFITAMMPLSHYHYR